MSSIELKPGMAIGPTAPAIWARDGRATVCTVADGVTRGPDERAPCGPMKPLYVWEPPGPDVVTEKNPRGLFVSGARAGDKTCGSEPKRIDIERGSRSRIGAGAGEGSGAPRRKTAHEGMRVSALALRQAVSAHLKRFISCRAEERRGKRWSIQVGREHHPNPQQHADIAGSKPGLGKGAAGQELLACTPRSTD